MAWWTDEDVSFYRGKSCVVCYEDTGKGVVTYIKAFDNSVSAKEFLKEEMNKFLFEGKEDKPEQFTEL